MFQGSLVGQVNFIDDEDDRPFSFYYPFGDVVLFGKYSGTEVKINNEEHLIMREDDILAVVE
ncbi:MAG TPA: hypothetical protein PKM34_10265 [Bacteroidales bacterium]|nr:hypothetical protein [Bacteroidales bacterium]